MILIDSSKLFTKFRSGNGVTAVKIYLFNFELMSIDFPNKTLQGLFQIHPPDLYIT